MRMEKIMKRLDKFNTEREWKQFHSPVNLAKSISIEAGELLECFQWSNDKYNLDKVKEELSDVLIYCLDMCSVLDLDVNTIINDKISLNEIKYPIEKAKGVSTKYDKL